MLDRSRAAGSRGRSPPGGDPVPGGGSAPAAWRVCRVSALFGGAGGWPRGFRPDPVGDFFPVGDLTANMVVKSPTGKYPPTQCPVSPDPGPVACPAASPGCPGCRQTGWNRALCRTVCRCRSVNRKSGGKMSYNGKLSYRIWPNPRLGPAASTLKAPISGRSATRAGLSRRPEPDRRQAGSALEAFPGMRLDLAGLLSPESPVAGRACEGGACEGGDWGCGEAQPSWPEPPCRLQAGWLLAVASRIGRPRLSLVAVESHRPAGSSSRRAALSPST